MPLQLAYGCEEGSGLTLVDSSPNGRDATLVNGPPRVGGYFGDGIDYDGSTQFASMPDSSFMQDWSAITLMFWVKRSETQANWDRPLSWADGSASQSHDVMVSNMTSNQWRVRFRVDNYTETYLSQENVTNTRDWKHFCFTWAAGGNLIIYVDAQESTSTPSHGPGNMTMRGMPGSIGKNGSAGDYFPAIIDEVRLYDEQLSQPEIAALMNTPVVGPGIPAPGSRLLLTGAGV